MTRPPVSPVDRARRALGLLTDTAGLISSRAPDEAALRSLAKVVASRLEGRLVEIHLATADSPQARRVAAFPIVPPIDVASELAPIVDRVLTHRDVVRGAAGDGWDVIAAPIVAHDLAYGALVVVRGAAACSDESDGAIAVVGCQLGVAIHADRLANDLRATRQHVLEAGKLSALGQIVAGVAHDLNSPLTSVMGYAQLVQQQVARRGRGGPRGKHLQEDVASIVAEAENATRIVRNLLLFARRQQPVRAQHDLSFLCSQVLDLRAHDLRVNGIEVITEFAPDFPLVLVDAAQIRHVFLNLILNAEHALDTRQTRRLAIRGVADAVSGTVRVEIEDSGHGIEPAILGRVFDPFFTTRPPGGGTGLGLSIVSAIVRDHGGDVWVESQPEQGARFFVRLPASKPLCGADPGP